MKTCLLLRCSHAKRKDEFICKACMMQVAWMHSNSNSLGFSFWNSLNAKTIIDKVKFRNDESAMTNRVFSNALAVRHCEQ